MGFFKVIQDIAKDKQVIDYENTLLGIDGAIDSQEMIDHKKGNAALGKKKGAFSDSHRKKISEANSRRVLSEETKSKISASNKDKKKGPRSAEHTKNLKAAQKRRWSVYYNNKLNVSSKKN